MSKPSSNEHFHSKCYTHSKTQWSKNNNYSLIQSLGEMWLFLKMCIQHIKNGKIHFGHNSFEYFIETFNIPL